MSAALSPRDLIEGKRALGWPADRIALHYGVPLKRVREVFAAQDEAVREGGPVVFPPLEVVQRRREVEAEEARRRTRRARLLAELEAERRIVQGNARAARTPARIADRRAYRAAWARVRGVA